MVTAPGRLHLGVGGLPPGPSVVAIGQFDGVHMGHRRLVAEAVRRADRLGVPAGAVTFDRHPAAVLAPDREPATLTGLDEKAELLASCGVDFVLALPLSPDLLRTSAADFVTDLLAGALDCRAVVVGTNFRFGHRAAGDPALLGELGRSHGMDVVVADLVDVAGRPVSSTRIRAEIAAGRVRSAARLLGRPHRVGAVVTGSRGRRCAVRLGTGTARPGSGRYRVSVDTGDRPGARLDTTDPAAVTLELCDGTAPARGTRLWLGLLTELG
ncbi:FAD synthetase family protein [Pseudonocardia sp. N23]|uniref:FAD synthetase family protein n=1 Tax=Pseudonocardia sp. N23 TaxID=1987376 RepID=UPI000C025EC6|nr:FAD synthetase family protein [Pseudonocardia sp. N23]GAY11055.1 riboflavin kinase [Pseudonocardia sp. N23]